MEYQIIKIQKSSMFSFLKLINIGLFFLFMNSVEANESMVVITEPLTLEEAKSKAESDNPSLAKSIQMFLSAQTLPDQVSSLPDPMLTLGAMNLPTDTFERDQEAMTQLQIGVSQIFPFPGKRRLKEESSEYMVEVANFSVQEKKLTIMHMVTVSWWELFYLDKALDTLAENKALLRKLIKVAETKYKTGEGLQQDVLLSHLELSKLLEKELMLNALRIKQTSLLNSLLNNDHNTIIVIPETFGDYTPDIFEVSSLYKVAERNSPLLKKSEAKVSQSSSNITLAKREYLPDFTVGVNYGDREGDNPLPRGGERTDFMSVMLGIKIPLYAYNKQKKQVKQKLFEAQEAQYSYQEIKNNLFNEITSEYAGYIQAKEQLDLFKNGIIPQSKQTAESMLAGYQVSQVDFLNLVRSQISLLNYELLYWKTFAHSHKSLSKLQTLVGKEEIYE